MANKNLERQDKLQKGTAKFWGIVLGVVVVVAIIWAVVSNLG